MAKRMFVMTVIFVLTVSAAFAGGRRASSASGGSETIKIGCIVFQEDMFMQMYTMGCVAAAKDAGVEINTANSNNDAAQEANLINTYTEQGYKGVVMQTPDDVTALQTIKVANGKGVQFVIGSILSDEASKYVLTSILTSNESLGYLSGEAAVRYIKEKAISPVNVAVVQFKAQSSFYSNLRSSSFLKALDDGGIKYNLVADQDAWMMDTAITTATDILTAHPEVNIIYGANDGATVGSTMAVKNLGLVNKVSVFGCDASAQICNLLLDPSYSLVATAAQDAYRVGYDCTQTLIKGIKGEDISAVKGKTVEINAMPLNDYDSAAVRKYLEEISKY
ncbi:MAG: substrate-binding domain-containing protein [Treponema sp.]|nr:substrate-binding domain-containing protein [Treponema sp.]